MNLIAHFFISLLASLSTKTALTTSLLCGHDRVLGILDVALAFLPDEEAWLVDKLVSNGDVPVVDEGTGVVDALGKGVLVDLGLEAAVKEIGGSEGKDIIELLLGLIENAKAGKAAEKSGTFEDTLGVVFWKHEKVTSSLPELGNSVMGTPEFSLVLKTVFTDNLEFVVDALLLVWAHWLLESSAEVVACHLLKGQATTDNR